jgi:hypothetical protein
MTEFKGLATEDRKEDIRRPQGMQKNNEDTK